MNPMRPQPMKIGDDIMNSDRCPIGQKYNTRLGKCIPTSAMVQPDGTVVVAAPERGSNQPDPDTPAPETPSPDAAIKAEGAKRARAKILSPK